MCQHRCQIGLGGAAQKQTGLFPQQLRRAGLQPIHGFVFAVDVVTHRGFPHSLVHSGARTGHRIAAQVNYRCICHPQNPCSNCANIRLEITSGESFFESDNRAVVARRRARISHLLGHGDSGNLPTVCAATTLVGIACAMISANAANSRLPWHRKSRPIRRSSRSNQVRCPSRLTGGEPTLLLYSPAHLVCIESQ